MEQINDYYVHRVNFSEDEVKEIQDKVQALCLNPGAANGTVRTEEQRKSNKLTGFLAEKAVYDFLRNEYGTIVYQKENQDMANQIDLFIGTKTVEIRSSQVHDINTALFGKRKNGDSIYHLVGNYTTAYKKQEKVKDYYIWVAFEETFNYCYIVGGATKKQIQEAPEITMVPKGTACNNPTKYHALRPDQIYNIKDLLERMRPSSNETLSLAKKNKEDEFYTLYSTVEKELEHYSTYLKDKIIYLPCDSPEQSNFWKYLYDNFHKLQLKKLRATFLEGYCAKYDGNITSFSELQEGGSYDSDECREMFDLSDVIITNPPFSLFRSFVLQCIYYNKDFIILGNQNASTTKDIFPLFKENKIRYGYFAGSEQFSIPKDYETRSKNVKTDKDGNRLLTVEGIRWFTTFPVQKDNKLVVTKKIDPFTYPCYDNYPAHEVSFVKDIPIYDGLLGVPISYLNVYDPNQYELIGTSGELAGPIEIEGKRKEKPGRFYLDGKRLYERIVIKRKE